MLSIGIFFCFFFLINSFNAAPYEIENNHPNENATWNDLNKTVKNFNRSKMIMFDFSNLNNSSWSLNMEDQKRENGSNIIISNLDQILEIGNATDQNSTATEFPIVMDSKIGLKDINVSKVNPLVEIMEPIPENQTFSIIDGTIEIGQLVANLKYLISPLDNETVNNEQIADVNANVTGEFFPIASNLVMNKFDNFELNSLIKLVAIESSNDSCLAADIYVLEASIKHSIIKYLHPKIGHFSVKLSYNSSIDLMSNTVEEIPFNLTVLIKSPVEISEVEFRNALVEYAANTKRCVMQNQTEIRCSLFRLKDSTSLLRISDYWIELDELIPTQEKLRGNEFEIFSYKPVWIVGLAIIGGIIAIFFLGCIVAICYTRRPYKRCSKVYEIDTATRKNNQPFIPGVHPATKASAVTKTKEMYYQ